MTKKPNQDALAGAVSFQELLHDQDDKHYSELEATHRAAGVAYMGDKLRTRVLVCRIHRGIAK